MYTYGDFCVLGRNVGPANQIAALRFVGHNVHVWNSHLIRYRLWHVL